MKTMTEEEHGDLAQDILSKAMDELLAAGVNHVQALHGFVYFAINTLPAFCCNLCLEDHYNTILV